MFCRGYWDFEAMIRDHDLGEAQFSRSEAEEDKPKEITGSWTAAIFSPAPNIFVILRNRAGDWVTVEVWAASHEAAKAQFAVLRERYKRKPKRTRGRSNFSVITTRHGY